MGYRTRYCLLSLAHRPLHTSVTLSTQIGIRIRAYRLLRPVP